MSLPDIDWTAVAAVATALAAGVTAWMACMTRKMSVHAGTQASTARATLESTQRPIIVTTARTARLPHWNADASPPTIREREGAFLVPVQNIGPGAGLNVRGVIMWRLHGEENGEDYKVTTTICVSPHPVQLAPGAETELEFVPLNSEPISAPNLLVRLWYESAAAEHYWTAEHLSSHVQGYRSATGQGQMPTDVEEAGAVPEQFAEHLADLRREELARRFGSGVADERAEPDPADGS